MTEVAIVGAGRMGHGLALVYALGGYNVRLTDSDATALSDAHELIETVLTSLREVGEIDDTWTTDRLASSLRYCPTLAEAVSGAEFVIEAITEDTGAKQTLYTELAGLMGPDAILASNTSHLDVFPLIPETLQPRSLITHWYLPPYLIDLVDIFGGPHTDPAVVEVVRATIAAMDKQPLVFRKFVPGYVANRIQSAIGREVYRLLDDGVVTPDQVDDSIIHGLALRFMVLGHLAKSDFSGLALLQRGFATRSAELPPSAQASSTTLDQLVSDGHTGVMSGRGFFDWSDRSPDEWLRERDRRLIALKRTMRDFPGPLRGTYSRTDH